MGLFRKTATSGPVPPAGEPVDLWGGRGWCNQQVAGESFRSGQIQGLFSTPTPRGEELRETALLAREPGNPHDPNAVAVFVQGVHVGYLPRGDAPRYQGLLRQLESQGLVAATDCRIWGQTFNDLEYDARGHQRTVQTFHASITISLAEPHLCLPLTSPPEEPHVDLPHGAAIQIQGEEDCMEAIAPVLRPEGIAWIHSTLHEIEPSSARGKPLVEVRINGQRVGQLTPKMSGDLLPAVRLLTGKGVECVARATVEGNSMKAEVVLFCARAHQLPPDWPGDLNDHDSEPALPQSPPSVGPVEVPAKPRVAFSAPPGWPVPPDGWEPFDGWAPDPSWPPPPPGWAFWRLVE